MAKRECSVAVVGATGAVGQVMLQVLAERQFPVRALRALASERSAGKTVDFRGAAVRVERLTAEAFRAIEDGNRL